MLFTQTIFWGLYSLNPTPPLFLNDLGEQVIAALLLTAAFPFNRIVNWVAHITKRRLLPSVPDKDLGDIIIFASPYLLKCYRYFKTLDPTVEKQLSALLDFIGQINRLNLTEDERCTLNQLLSACSVFSATRPMQTDDARPKKISWCTASSRCPTCKTLHYWLSSLLYFTAAPLGLTVLTIFARKSIARHYLYVGAQEGIALPIDCAHAPSNEAIHSALEAFWDATFISMWPVLVMSILLFAPATANFFYADHFAWPRRFVKHTSTFLLYTLLLTLCLTLNLTLPNIALKAYELGQLAVCEEFQKTLLEILAQSQFTEYMFLPFSLLYLLTLPIKKFLPEYVAKQSDTLWMFTKKSIYLCKLYKKLNKHDTPSTLFQSNRKQKKNNNGKNEMEPLLGQSINTIKRNYYSNA